MTTLSAETSVGRGRALIVVGVTIIAAVSALYATSGFGWLGATPAAVSAKQVHTPSSAKAATTFTESMTVSAKTVSGATTVDTQAAKVLFDRSAAFVDTRIDADWEAGRIPGAAHLELKAHFTEAALRRLFRPDAEIVIYCNGETCLRSSEAAMKAVGWGFTQVFYFRDGYPSWKAASYPVE